jgi:hypothetical protein
MFPILELEIYDNLLKMIRFCYSVAFFSSELLDPKTNKTISFLARQIRVYVTFHSSFKLWFLQNVNMYCSYIHSFIGDIDGPSQSLPSPRFFHSFYW